MPSFACDVGIVGGAGHVGLPLALTFADCGLRTVLYDINAAALDRIRAGEFPFQEDGGDAVLRRVLAGDRLLVRETPEQLGECRYVILVVGTPVDEHLNPSFTGIRTALEQ